MIYIDLDGVLADLDGWIAERCLAATKDEREFNLFALHNYKTTFLESPLISKNLELIYYKDYRILSALPKPENFFKYAKEVGMPHKEVIRRYQHLMRNKLNWISKNGLKVENAIIVFGSGLKSAYCQSPEDILYDDYQKNVDEWNAAGGKGILIKG